MTKESPGLRAVLLAAFVAVTTGSCIIVPVQGITPLIEGRERVGPLRSSSKGLPEGVAASLNLRNLLQASPELKSLADEVVRELDQGRTPAEFAFVHVDVADGWLIGLDHGEWGGALWWFGRTLEMRTLMLAGNVTGIVADRASAIAICGLSHLSNSRGQLERLVRDETWRLHDTMPLRAAPVSFVLGMDGELELAFANGKPATYRQGAIR